MMLAASHSLLGQMALHKEPVYVVFRVLPAVLMKSICLPGKSHGRCALVLRHNDISFLQKIRQDEISRVGTLVHRLHPAVIRFNPVTRVTDDRHGDLEFSGRPFRLTHDRASVPVYPYFHNPSHKKRSCDKIR
jgi:hypothetical protein